MNAINRINKINQQELENNVSDSSSWHMDYKDTSYIYIGGLNPKLKDKDILIIFSQFGIPTHLKLIKEEDENGEIRNKGFGYLKYQDFRSCVLAIDNLNGVVIYDKRIRVDHCWFELRGDNETEDDYLVDYSQYVPEVKSIKAHEETEKVTSQKSITDVPHQKSQGQEEKQEDDEELRDPLLDMNKATDDDDFTDPMAGFVKKRSSEDRDKSRHKRHRSHRKHEHSGSSRRDSKDKDGKDKMSEEVQG